jgi:hypothetical protein
MLHKSTRHEVLLGSRGSLQGFSFLISTLDGSTWCVGLGDILTCVLDVPRSILEQDTGYPDWNLFLIILSPSKQIPGYFH